jgi:hypothetical protein
MVLLIDYTYDNSFYKSYYLYLYIFSLYDKTIFRIIINLLYYIYLSTTKKCELNILNIIREICSILCLFVSLCSYSCQLLLLTPGIITVSRFRTLSIVINIITRRPLTIMTNVHPHNATTNTTTAGPRL